MSQVWQKIVSDGADVVSSSRVFQTRGPATVKTRLPTVDSLTDQWYQQATRADRTTWRTTCSDAVSLFEERRVNSLKEKRVQRKEGPPVDSDFQCVTCGQMCRLRIGLYAHREHIARDEIRCGSVQRAGRAHCPSTGLIRDWARGSRYRGADSCRTLYVTYWNATSMTLEPTQEL